MFSATPQDDYKEDNTQLEKKYLYELWINPAEYQQWKEDIERADNFALWFEQGIHQKIAELIKELDTLKNPPAPTI